MFKLGDIVILKEENNLDYSVEAIFLGKTFIITNIEDNFYILNNGYRIIKNVFEDAFKLFKDIDAIDSIIYGITSQMQDEKGPSIECPREIKCLPIELIKNEIPIFEPYWNEQKENNMEKILQLYKEKQTKLIEHKYDKQLEELEENDELRVYLEQATETVKSLLELEDEKIVRIEIIDPYVNLTPKTIQKREEIIKLIREEKAELNNKIEEIQALLELAPNYEEKIRILRDYGIIDKKKNIIL